MTSPRSDALIADDMPSDRIEELEAENRHLELQRDAAKLRAEIEGLGMSWWRRGGVVTGILTGITTIISSAVAVTSMYQAKVQADKEVALKEAAQRNEIAISIQRVNDQIWAQYVTNDNEGARQRALRFISATTPYDKIGNWAAAEKQIVDSEVAVLKEELRDAKAKAEKLVESLRHEEEKGLAFKHATPGNR